MALSKNPNQEGPKKPTPSEMALITRFMSSKIGKPTPTKQAKPEEVKKAFESAKQRGVVPKTPELQQPTTMGAAKPIVESEALLKGDREAMENAVIAANANRINQGFIEADAYKNTINRMAEFDGIKPPTPGSSMYNQYKSQIEFSKDNLVLSSDEKGNPIFGKKMGLLDSYNKSYDAFNEAIASGKYYQDNDINKVRSVLEAKYRGTKPSTMFQQVPNEFMATLGGLQNPITTGSAISIMANAFATATGIGAIPSAVLGGIGQFGTVGSDMVNSRYGAALEENYALAREQGMNQKDAYDKAKSVAETAANYETAAQIPFSFAGALGGISKGLPTSSAKLAEKAPIINKAIKTFARGFAENLRVGSGFGGIVGLGRLGTDIKSEQEGIKIENNIERAIQEGGHMMAMHMGIHTLTSAPKALEFVPKSMKSFAKKLLSADEATTMSFIEQMEKAGLYEQGTAKKIKESIKSLKAAEKKTPEFGGDDVRRTVASGLIEKRTNLEKEMAKVDKQFQAPIQVQIDDINTRLRKLNEVENPFEVEVTEDGKPFITKTQKDATKISTGEIKEGLPEGGIGQYTGVEEIKPVEVPKQAEAPTTDISNRPISGTEEVVKPAETVKFSDKIRKLKIDESVLTGGDKGVAQSNIAGLPIGIYNASIEAIALSVEAGEKIAVAIENQIKSLKEGGYKVDESRFTKNIKLIERLESDKKRIAAEGQMEGISASDYSDLQRFALEKYNENPTFKDPTVPPEAVLVELGKNMREELSKKIDTSNISDNVFETMAYDVVSSKKGESFLPGPAKKLTPPTESYTKEQILTNPKEVFKTIFGAARKQAKEAKARLDVASQAISDAVYKQKGLSINPKSVARAIKMFVNDSMDIETASIAFQENINEIRRIAENSVKFGEVKKAISNIKAASKSKSYGTIATRRTTREMDFMAPSKIRDYDEQGNVLDTDASLNKYMSLLEDYRRSVSGETAEAVQARNALNDFLVEQRELYENAQTKKREAKKAQFEAKYDKLLADGKIAVDENTGLPTVSKEEFVDGMINPNKLKTQETENAIGEAELEEAPTLTDQAVSRQQVLKEAIDEGEIDVEYLEAAKQIASADTKRISPQNIKLFNNIIEDVLNGEEPSRFGQIKTDIESSKLREEAYSTKMTIRPITKIERAGIINRLFGASKDAYNTLGFSNLFRVLTMRDEDTTTLRAMTTGKFEKAIKDVNAIAKVFTKNISDIFTGKTAIIDGKAVKFTSPRLTESNSYRLGIVSALEQTKDFAESLNNTLESLMYYSKVNADEGGYTNYIKNTKQALESLGLVEGFTQDENGVITGVVLSQEASLDKMLSTLNDREAAALKASKNGFRGLSEDVRKAARDYYGVDIDISSDDYLPRVIMGGKKDVLAEFDNPVFSDLPSHIKKMRASSTFERTPNLNAKDANGNYILYDFDFFRRMPEKFHETATTAYTSESTSTMSKFLNSKEFSNFINGRLNAEPKQYDSNKRRFIEHVNEYVNMERKPYVVTKEMAQQRNRFYRFVYGKLLNTWDAAAKQYIPGTITLLTEAGGIPFLKANELYYKSLMSGKNKDILVKFLSQTSQVNRVTSGIEALASKGANIDNNAAIRNFKDAADYLNSTLLAGSKSLEFGDNAVTIQGLIVGYMKGLKLSGKLKNYSDFNLETELNNGLDQYALSYAENYLAFLNNESTFAGKAKVFREGNASVLRMLQSFNHNQTTNFLIDLGRLGDSINGAGTKDDAAEAIKRIFQFASNQILFGATSHMLGNLTYNLAQTGLEYAGVNLSADLSKEKGEKDKAAFRIGAGLIADAALGRQNIIVAQGAKAALKGAAEIYLKNERKEMERMGYDASNTIYAQGYSPIFRNDYIGASGTFIQDAERYWNGLTKEDEIGAGLEESQRNALKKAAYIKGASMLFPTRDLERISSNLEKSIMYRKLPQINYDAQQLYASTDKTGTYTPIEIKEAQDYINKKLSEDPNFRNYLDLKVKPFADKLSMQNYFKTAASVHGEEFGKVVANIVGGKVKDNELVLNNRYPLVYPSGETIPVQDIPKSNSIYNKQIQFLLMNGIMSVDDYAFSVAFDKDGKLRKDISEDSLNREVVKRYQEAMAMPGVIGSVTGKTEGFSDQSIVNAFKRYSAERYTLKQKQK